jgi:hypothetical protein
MRAWLTLVRQMFANAVVWRIDRREAAPHEPPPAGRSKFPAWAVILIVVVVLGTCVAAICWISVTLTLLNPTIGNVFSNIIEDIATPTP